VKIDKEGDLTGWQHDYYIYDNKGCYAEDIEKTDNGYALYGKTAYQQGQYAQFLLLIDFNGNVLDTKIFDYYTGSSFIKTNDNGFARTWQPSVNPKFRVSKLDETGYCADEIVTVEE